MQIIVLPLLLRQDFNEVLNCIQNCRASGGQLPVSYLLTLHPTLTVIPILLT